MPFQKSYTPLKAKRIITPPKVNITPVKTSIPPVSSKPAPVSDKFLGGAVSNPTGDLAFSPASRSNLNVTNMVVDSASVPNVQGGQLAEQNSLPIDMLSTLENSNTGSQGGNMFFSSQGSSGIVDEEEDTNPIKRFLQKFMPVLHTDSEVKFDYVKILLVVGGIATFVFFLFKLSKSKN